MAFFEGIGRIGDYAQMKNLRREMKYRVRTGNSLAEAMGSPVQPNKMKASALQKTREKDDANREMQIRQKLRQGQKLSATDKQYLKDNNPDLYEKVTRIEERREALARALRRAKSKEEAQRAVAQANISVLSEMQKGGGGAPNFSGTGGSDEGASAPMMTAGGTDAAGDALDAPLADGEAVPTTGEMQGAIGRDALAHTGSDAHTAEASADRYEGQADEKKEGFQSGPSTRDAYGNRRVLSRKEMDDMLRTAQEQGKLTPLDNEKLYLLRALQREWMEYANSEEYKNLPNTIPEAAEEEAHPVRRKKREEDGVPVRSVAPNADAVFAAAHSYYRASHGGEPFEAKG